MIVLRASEIVSTLKARQKPSCSPIHTSGSQQDILARAFSQGALIEW
jgi:hypothetical protein